MYKRSYDEMSKLNTFEERFEYLMLSGKVGEITFGGSRKLNQNFYMNNPEWKRIRNLVIARDNGCDLGIPGREIYGPVYVHHINPLTRDDIVNHSDKLFDLNNLVSVSKLTHDSIHYGNGELLDKELVDRKPNDTCPWK